MIGNGLRSDTRPMMNRIGEIMSIPGQLSGQLQSGQRNQGISSASVANGINSQSGMSSGMASSMMSSQSNQMSSAQSSQSAQASTQSQSTSAVNNQMTNVR